MRGLVSMESPSRNRLDVERRRVRLPRGRLSGFREGRPMFQGQLLAIFIAPGESAEMQALEQAQAQAGHGLVGDRYAQAIGTFSKTAEPKPDQEVTLIESEALSAAASEYGIELRPEQTRRNLLTRGVPLNHLVSREFFVGSVR